MPELYYALTALSQILSSYPFMIVSLYELMLYNFYSCTSKLNCNTFINLVSCFFRHEFHKTCVDPWLLEHRTCPMCKMDILKHYGFIVSSTHAVYHIYAHVVLNSFYSILTLRMLLL